ncbi:MAG: hypothetical protein LAP85_09920 [Acidobacteriia bacterium]|nr:hypothetical protein [Terriglobia bacterium]
MKSKTMALLVLLGLALAIGVAAAQKNKPWTEWTMQDAEKILNQSGWGQTQTETDTTETYFTPGARPIDSRGAMNQATGVNYRIRFLSAKPIRQAFLRILELNPTKSTPQQTELMRQYVDRKFEKIVVIAVDYDQQGLAKDGRFTQPVFQAFGVAITATMKNNTYLDIKGGKRVFLQEYQAPIPGEGLGAKFIFPRIVDDKPILDAKTGDVRFYAEFPKAAGNNQLIKLDMRFKVKDLMYEGILEF